MMGFQDILGNDMIKEHFKKAIENNKISHAYILTGEEGTGRKSIANAFSMALLCEKGGKEPCMVCHSCKQVLSGNHPDLIYVKHEKPNSIGVDDIREQINDTIMIRPYSSYYKIYIVDEAEKMTVQAQNALLKTMEEPPSYAVIILITTNQEAFLPTILSRCVQLKLKPLKDFTVKSYLSEHLGVPEKEAEICAAFARGNLGKAIHLASSDEFKELYQKVMMMVKNISTMDIVSLLDHIREMKEQNFDMEDVLDLLQLWYRDVLMYKVTKDMNLLIFKDEYKVINGMVQKVDYAGLEKILASIDTARTRLSANVNMELAMELLLLTMKNPL
ncbi:MAG: DNA polymerase III subunit delta' [Lachnospiraceae bacterium]|nr:DNA polymerase III subunit delta' [Lachnospiraceae bacterium]